MSTLQVFVCCFLCILAVRANKASTTMSPPAELLGDLNELLDHVKIRAKLISGDMAEFKKTIHNTKKREEMINHVFRRLAKSQTKNDATLNGEKLAYDTLRKTFRQHRRDFGCDDGWVRWPGRTGLCYKFQLFDKNTTSVNDAREACESMSATLAVVLSTKQNDFISSLAPSHISILALAARDDTFEEVWEWPDNSELTYKNWANGQPDNCCGGQNCLVILREKSNTWDDVACDHQYKGSQAGYVCEKTRK